MRSRILLLLLTISCASVELPPGVLPIPLYSLDAPVIEITLHGKDAERVKLWCEAFNHGTDTCACNFRNVIMYFGTECAQDQELRRHECRHIIDERALGWAVYEHDYRVEATNNGYEGNKFEVAARAAGEDPNAPTPDTDCRSITHEDKAGADKVAIRERLFPCLGRVALGELEPSLFDQADPVFRWLAVDVVVAVLPRYSMGHGEHPADRDGVDDVFYKIRQDVLYDLAAPHQFDSRDTQRSTF